jgi:hypothetical protein
MGNNSFTYLSFAYVLIYTRDLIKVQNKCLIKIQLSFADLMISQKFYAALHWF